jgi:hypothetical protein
VLVLLAAGLACAQAPTAQPRIGEEWQPLFNGKDLTGWVSVGGEKWVVEDGTIYGEGLTKGYGYLTTEKSYKDFFLRLSFKCESGGNSGVYLRTSFKPGTADVSNGYQVEIDRNLNHHTGGLYGDNRAWWVWPASENETVLRPYDWNDMLIQVIGNRTVVRLNGVPMVDYTNPTPKSFDGVIAFQLHAGGEGKMRFKDIFIRDLSVR